MYKGVIFDLDGTLLNTGEDLADAVNYALKLNGKPTHENDTIISKMVGNGVKNLITRALGESANDSKLLEKTLADFKAYYGKHCEDKTREYDGVKEMLLSLKARGIKTAIVSNKYDKAVKTLAKKYFGDLIDIAYGEMENVPKKPNPALVFAVLDEFNLDVKECVYVGDSEVDILTAKNAKIDCILVAWGFKGKSFLVENGGERICETVPQLLYEITK